MKEIFLIQNSPEWLKERMTHIGASDVPSIMGTCDFRDWDDIFKSKTVGSDFKGNYATERGHSLEDIALDMYRRGWRKASFRRGILGCSLDGYFDDENLILEAKAPAIWKHTLALCGFVPETYKDQIQAQLWVMDAPKAIYISFHDTLPEGFNLATVEVYPCRKRQAEILWMCRKFWHAIRKWKKDHETKTPDLPSSTLEIDLSGSQLRHTQPQSTRHLSFSEGIFFDEALPSDAYPEPSAQ